MQHAYAFEVGDDDSDVVVGYFMWRFLTVKLEVCPEDISDYCVDWITNCPVVHIEYIAIDKLYQCKGVGKFIIYHILNQTMELCKTIPSRLITLDALKEKCDWYQSLGFCVFDENDKYNDSSPIVRMYIDCLLNKELVDNYIEV